MYWLWPRHPVNVEKMGDVSYITVNDKTYNDPEVISRADEFFNSRKVHLTFEPFMAYESFLYNIYVVHFYYSDGNVIMVAKYKDPYNIEIDGKLYSTYNISKIGKEFDPTKFRYALNREINNKQTDLIDPGIEEMLSTARYEDGYLKLILPNFNAKSWVITEIKGIREKRPGSYDKEYRYVSKDYFKSREWKAGDELAIDLNELTDNGNLKLYHLSFSLSFDGSSNMFDILGPVQEEFKNSQDK